MCLCALVLLAACRNKTSDARPDNGAFVKKTATADGAVERIATSGEFIVGTLSGPDTYFEYQGRGMGLQYALAEDFAAEQGAGVRVEVAADTAALVQLLKKGDIDAIALALPETLCAREGLTAAGVRSEKHHTAWAVRADAADLAAALDDWYGDGVVERAQTKERTWMKERTTVRRHVHAPYISREKGVISTYDPYFKEAARYTGWDWRLIAAQCYQESGFDPNARSWAGAAGLMQIMPATARQYGLAEDRLYAPIDNIAAAARIVRDLQGKFADVRDAEERIRFVLASYNAGIGHIRDAQALTRKHGGNAARWSDVSRYVRALMQPQYYRDPVVRHGYMIGNETADYVDRIMERWASYGGSVRYVTSPSSAAMGSTAADVRSGSGGRTTPHKPNRYSKEQRILSPEELAGE